MKEQKWLFVLSQSFIGTGFFFLYVQHVRSIFESRTNIAHLSELERDSLFRREDALYYSFYKTLAEGPDFWSGYEKLKNVSSIEYPNSVNVLQRFHLLPELSIAYIYQTVRRYGSKDNFLLFSCWRTQDARLVAPQRRCETFGTPLQFYLEFIWLLGGLTVLIIYVYGSHLSENIFGGIYAVVSYIMFHSYASKIYERPMARENFAFPFVFWQICFLCMCIDGVTVRKAHNFRIFMMLKLIILTTVSLLCWQFSSILFTTQILIMMTPWSLSSVPISVYSMFTMDYAVSQILSNILAYYLSFGNRKFIFAWQLGPAIGLFFVSIVRRFKHQTIQNEFSMKTISLGVLMATTAQGTIIDLLEKIGITHPMDNTFSLSRDLFVHWVLQVKVNFITGLVSCNPSYGRMVWSDLWDLMKTLIVKPYCMYGVVMLAQFFRKWRKSGERKMPSAEYIERAKKYVLEDFLEDNHIYMRDMSNKETENDLNECLKLLEMCEYDYERYKKEKKKLKSENPDEHMNFINDIRRLKNEINELNDKFSEKMALAGNNKNNENNEKEEQLKPPSTEAKTKPSKSETTKQNEPNNERRSTRIPKLNSKRTASNNAQAKSTTTTTSSMMMTSNEEGSALPMHILGFHYLYSFIQMGVFTIIGLSIKKLFFLSFTQGCVIAPTICFKILWYDNKNNKHRNLFWSVSLVVFLTSVFHPGLMNIHEEYSPQAYRAHVSDDLDTMLEWIQMNTERDAVFAGPVDIIGTVHLATRRPIVNHAHLEMRQMIDRTEHVYSVFSRQQSSDIYNQCSQLKIQYLIISLKDCTNEIQDECNILSIWDDMQPAYRKYPQFCSELVNKNIPSFTKVFSNDFYSVIKMFSQSVQINLKYNKMAEKVM